MVLQNMSQQKDRFWMGWIHTEDSAKFFYHSAPILLAIGCFGLAVEFVDLFANLLSSLNFLNVEKSSIGATGVEERAAPFNTILLSQDQPASPV